MILDILLRVLFYSFAVTVSYLFGYAKGYQYSKWEDYYENYNKYKED